MSSPEFPAFHASWSITRRLTVLYTLSAFAMLVLSTGFLYWVLSSNLGNEGREFLADKIHILRSILKEHSDISESLDEEVKREVLAHEFEKYYIRILDEKGRLFTETPGIDGISSQPLLFPNPAEPAEALPRGIKWRGNGKCYLLMASWAEANAKEKGRHLLQLVLDITDDERLLADYRRKIMMVLFFGIIFSAGAGVLVARRGMRPLQQITEAAQRITAAQLHERMTAYRWPKELASHAAAFDEMLSRLEDSFSRLSQFSADLAHELRTPIHNLMGQTEVSLSQMRTPEEYRQVLESNLEEYGRLSRMIDSLLFLARADKTQIQIERSFFDVSREIEAVREFHDAVAEEQGVRVTCRGNAKLNADPILFRRAISNLLSNALQYTPQGGKIDVSIKQPDDRHVEISIRDTGSGIGPEHLPKIFDRFYRADRARSQYPQGTGLGLAIVKSIMELHGGTVKIESQPAQGTTVILSFPNPA